MAQQRLLAQTWGAAGVLWAGTWPLGVRRATLTWVSYLRKVALWQEAGGGSRRAIAGICAGLTHKVHKLAGER